MEIIHINLIVLFCFILLLAYIKIRYPFWNIQPVYHTYDFWKMSISNPYFVYKEKPMKTKFYDYENTITYKYSELPVEKYKEMENLVQCYYISSENVLNIITKENIRNYFTGYDEPVFVSFYNEKNINNDFYPIGFISSRPLNIIITPLKNLIRTSDYSSSRLPVTEYYKIYFVDFLSIHREHVDKKISRKLLQTHEFNTRVLNPSIKCSLFKKEIDLYDGVVPIIKYTTGIYYLRNLNIPKLPKHCTVSRVYKEELNFLTDFYTKIREHDEKTTLKIFPDLGSLQSMIKSELLYVYVLKKGLDFMGIYFIKDEKMQYDNIENVETLHFISSLNNCSSEKIFALGFFYVIKALMKYKTYYRMLLFDNVGNNQIILRTWKNKFSPIIENIAAYYTYNLIIPSSPFDIQSSFILV